MNAGDVRYMFSLFGTLRGGAISSAYIPHSVPYHVCSPTRNDFCGYETQSQDSLH